MVMLRCHVWTARRQPWLTIMNHHYQSWYIIIHHYHYHHDLFPCTISGGLTADRVAVSGQTKQNFRQGRAQQTRQSEGGPLIDTWNAGPGCGGQLALVGSNYQWLEPPFPDTAGTSCGQGVVRTQSRQLFRWIHGFNSNHCWWIPMQSTWKYPGKGLN